MGKHSHRKHSEGLNAGHEAVILGAVLGINGLDPDYAIHRVPGNGEGIRAGALATIDRFLRSGGEMTVPDITQPVDIGNLALAETVERIA